jgi:hypothetical protein
MNNIKAIDDLHAVMELSHIYMRRDALNEWIKHYVSCFTANNRASKVFMTELQDVDNYNEWIMEKLHREIGIKLLEKKVTTIEIKDKKDHIETIVNLLALKT